MTAGSRFRKALLEEKPLQIVGAMNAYVAIMAAKVGFKALYLSGASVANSGFGWPDVGATSLDNVLEEARRITGAVDLPLLVDVDTGWGSAYTISRAVKEMEKCGVATIQIEDQPFEKKCGHLSGKRLVACEEMLDRIKCAVDAKRDASFVIMARTDAFGVEGLEATIERAGKYREAGADMLFAEAIDSLDHYRAIKQAVDMPLLANITEFGLTPLFGKDELAKAGVDMVLYPLSVNRVMNFAALKALREIREKGTQNELLDEMQTRKELYEFLNYGEGR